MNAFEKEVINKVINDEHPILFASRVYQWLIRIHPFVDANGRIARLASDVILVNNALPSVGFSNRTQGYVSVHPPTKIEITPTLAAIRISKGVTHSLKILMGQ